LTPRPATAGKHDVRPDRNQFRHVFVNFVGISLAPANIDPHVATVDPAQFPQGLPEYRDAFFRFRLVRGTHEHADAPYLVGLLRTRCNRQRNHRATQDTEKFTPLHVRP
jgi:hypothetical protein